MKEERGKRKEERVEESKSLRVTGYELRVSEHVEERVELRILSL